jgi:outer membrane protein assembly complex protein YaeT
MVLLFLLTSLTAGAETAVRITGMKGKTEGQVLELMGGRLAHVRSDDASPSRADDAAFLVRQMLRKDGYVDVKVDWKVVSRTEILLIVQSGERLSLGTVTITGVPAADVKRLAKLYARPARKDTPLVAGDPPFREEDVETGLSYIRQELNADGYWSAEAKVTGRVTDPATGAVNVSIEVSRGPLYQIAQPQMSSSDGRGMSDTQTAAAPFIGRVASTGNINGMRLAVEEAFVSQGYPDAQISMSRTLDAPRYLPGFFIDLGKRVRLNRVHVEGLQRTRPGRIAERMKSLEGEWYDEAAMNKRIRGFLATGAFSSARVETTEISENTINATLHLEEAKAREFSVGVGVDSYQGPLLRTTYADRNLMGRLLGFSTGIELSARGVLGEAKLVDPWLFGTDVSATARLYSLIYSREGYSTLESGFEEKVTWKFGDHYTLELLAGYSVVNLSEEGLPFSELGETVYTHPRIRVTQMIDFRDSPVLPKKGWHLENPFEFGAATGDTATTYVRSGLGGGWYVPINSTYQLAFGGDFQMLVPSGDGEDLPIDLRLFNGGSRSVRSFPERELGPTADGYPTGGEATWNANAELIRTLAGSLRGVAFFDAGTLARNFDELGSSEIELAVGLGLRLDLPIGPVRLEYGYNLTQDDEDPSGTLHFAIGATF